MTNFSNDNLIKYVYNMNLGIEYGASCLKIRDSHSGIIVNTYEGSYATNLFSRITGIEEYSFSKDEGSIKTTVEITVDTSKNRPIEITVWLKKNRILKRVRRIVEQQLTDPIWEGIIRHYFKLNFQHSIFEDKETQREEAVRTIIRFKNIWCGSPSSGFNCNDCEFLKGDSYCMASKFINRKSNLGDVPIDSDSQ